MTKSLDISTINLEVIHDKIIILSAINPSQIVIDKSGDFTTWLLPQKFPYGMLILE